VFRYVASSRKNWDEGSFFQSDEEDYQWLVVPVLTRLHFDPRDKVCSNSDVAQNA
jgi:hypothetical protein